MSKYEKGMRLEYTGRLYNLVGTLITLKTVKGGVWTIEEHSGIFTEPYLDSDYHIMKPKEEVPHEPKEVYVNATKTFYAIGDVLLSTRSDTLDSIVKIDHNDTQFKCPIKLLNHGWIHEDMLEGYWTVAEQVDRALLYNTHNTDGKRAESIISDEITTGTISGITIETVENWDIEPEPVVNVSFDLDGEDNETVVNVSFDLEGEDNETVTLLSYEDGSTLLKVTQLDEDSEENGLAVYDEVLLALTINDMKKLKTALTSTIELSEMRK